MSFLCIARYCARLRLDTEVFDRQRIALLCIGSHHTRLFFDVHAGDCYWLSFCLYVADNICRHIYCRRFFPKIKLCLYAHDFLSQGAAEHLFQSRKFAGISAEHIPDRLIAAQHFRHVQLREQFVYIHPRLICRVLKLCKRRDIRSNLPFIHLFCQCRDLAQYAGCITATCLKC